MQKRIFVVLAVLTAFVINPAFAQTEDELKKEMKDLRVKQEGIRKEYTDGVKALNDLTMAELSKVQKGDKGARVKIMNERKTKMQELREKFRKNAEVTRAESDSIKVKIKQWETEKRERATAQATKGGK